MKNFISKDWLGSGQFFKFQNYKVFFKTNWNTEETGSEAVTKSNRPTLLLLHGFPTSSWDWKAMWDILDNTGREKQFNLICLDWLGFGFSDKPYPHHYSIYEQVEVLKTLLKKLELNELHILAHDYSVSIAQEILALIQERKFQYLIKSVVFLNGGMFSKSYHPRPIQKLLLSPFGPLAVPFITKRSLRKNFNAIFGKQTQPSATEIDEFWNLIIVNNGKRIIPALSQYLKERKENAERWENAVVETKIPCMLINGPVDPISGQSLLDKYRRIVPDAKTVVLEGIGHYPNVEAPESVCKALLKFVSIT